MQHTFYDKPVQELAVFIENSDATAFSWDEHWQKSDIVSVVRAGVNNRMLKQYTARFLKPGARIIDGGCGAGQCVYALDTWGYEAYGVDSAAKTIEKARQFFPSLRIAAQDVRKLGFPDSFFDGYWSSGVLEHCQDGYDDILREMRRVIKPGGYLFVTFPHLSLLRKLKIRLGLYDGLSQKKDKAVFYQFILDTLKVIDDVLKYGFRLILSRSFEATKGLKDEITLVRPFLQTLYDSHTLSARMLKFALSFLFAGAAGHSRLLIFRYE